MNPYNTIVTGLFRKSISSLSLKYAGAILLALILAIVGVFSNDKGVADVSYIFAIILSICIVVAYKTKNIEPSSNVAIYHWTSNTSYGNIKVRFSGIFNERIVHRTAQNIVESRLELGEILESIKLVKCN